MKMKSILSGMVVLTMAVPAAMAEAPVTAPMSDRVSRLESLMASQSSYQVQSSMQEMRDEIQTLRGMVEVQQHELQKLKERQEVMSAEMAKMSGGGAPALLSSGGPAVSAPAVGGTTAVASLPTDAETKLYQSAYVLLSEQKYSAAIPALEHYIHTYPSGQYVASAYYWLGETQTIANDLGQAKKAFRTVIDKYPTSPKAVDALLKLGMVYEDAGQYDQAQELYKQVVDKYPNAPQSRMAQDRIVQIENIDR